MKYDIYPSPENILVEPLKSKETKEYTAKALADVETSHMNELQFGRIIHGSLKWGQEFGAGDIVLYQKLAAHNTNFGTPRQILVPIEQIEGALSAKTA